MAENLRQRVEAGEERYFLSPLKGFVAEKLFEWKKAYVWTRWRPT